MNDSSAVTGREYGNMTRVIVAVHIFESSNIIDMEVPSHLPSSQLSKLLIQAIDPEKSGKFLINVESHGITLTQDQSLADAGIWDGAALSLRPTQSSAILESKSSRSKYPLLYAEVFIGRSPQLPTDSLRSSVIDLSGEIDSQTVSRVHACIRHQNDFWTLERLSQARNPVWIDSVEIQPHVQMRLSTGCAIRLGDVELVFAEQ